MMAGVRALPVAALLFALLLVTATVSAADVRYGAEAKDDSAAISGETTQEGEGDSGGDEKQSGAGSIAAPPPCSKYTLLDAVEWRYLLDYSECGPTANRPENLGGVEQIIPPREAVQLGLTPISVSLEDVQHLIVATGGLQVQPDRDWVLVNIDTIVWTGADVQQFDITVLNTPVAVEMTPLDFTWDFGDGSAPFTTTDPGAPWPDHTVAHTYTGAQPTAQVTLTTRWAGTFEVDGSGVTQTIQGLATTAESSAPFQVMTATPSLVAAR